MKKLFCFLAVVLLFPASVVFAMSPAPPRLTVVVNFAPENLALSVQCGDGSSKPMPLQKGTKCWETQYFLYWPEEFFTPEERGATTLTLVMQNGGERYELPFPAQTVQDYYGTATLDFKTRSLTNGVSALRGWLLFVVHTALTFAAACAVFFVFGYRKKWSWLAFVAVNILAQGCLNSVFINEVIYPGPNAVLALVFFAPIAFLAEIVLVPIVVGFIIKEHRVRRAVACAFCAGVASLAINVLMLVLLPS